MSLEKTPVAPPTAEPEHSKPTPEKTQAPETLTPPVEILSENESIKAAAIEEVKARLTESAETASNSTKSPEKSPAEHGIETHEKMPGDDHEKEHKKGPWEHAADNHEKHEKGHEHNSHGHGHGHHPAKPFGKREKMLGTGIAIGGLTALAGLGVFVEAPIVAGWVGLKAPVAIALGQIGMSGGIAMGLGCTLGLLFARNLLVNLYTEGMEALKKINVGGISLRGLGGGGKKAGGGGHAPAAAHGGGGDHH